MVSGASKTIQKLFRLLQPSSSKLQKTKLLSLSTKMRKHLQKEPSAITSGSPLPTTNIQMSHASVSEKVRDSAK